MSIFKKQLIRRALPVAFVVAFAGCERKEPRAYTAPKEKPFTPAQPAGQQEQPREGTPWRPALKYALPAGWKDLGADAANVGRFSAGEVMIAVTALGSMEGNETVLVNMWRQVRGQPPLEEAAALKTLSEVSIAGGTGRMFEVADNEGGAARRFIVAFTHKSEGSLFFKIQGDDAAVTAQKPAFFEFLKGVQIVAGEAPPPKIEAPAPAPAAPTAAGKIPEGWTSVAPGQMQMAKFTVPEKDGKKAEVTVSVFPSDTGGTVANVKRWRGQLGMPEADDAAILASAKPLEGIEGGLIVDLENAGRAMTGAIVPREGQWFFFKLLGDAPAVAAAREAFVGFVKTK